MSHKSVYCCWGKTLVSKYCNTCYLPLSKKLKNIVKRMKGWSKLSIPMDIEHLLSQIHRSIQAEEHSENFGWSESWNHEWHYRKDTGHFECKCSSHRGTVNIKLSDHFHSIWASRSWSRVDWASRNDLFGMLYTMQEKYNWGIPKDSYHKSLAASQ